MTARLRDADPTVRLFLTAFLVLLTAGYVLGVAFVSHTTGAGPRGISEEYRGTPEGSEAAELKYEKSADELYILLHNHILSLSLIFLVVGAIFYFSSLVGPGLKTFLMVEPFVAVGTTFGGIWLVRYVSGGFSWLVLASGVSMAVTYCAMTALILWELWRTPR